MMNMSYYIRLLSVFIMSKTFLASITTLTAPPKAPLIITIHDSVHTITSMNDCNASKWNNNANDACECCLIEQQTLVGGKLPAEKIIHSCITDKKMCTQKSITSLKSSKKIPQGSADQLMTAVYEDVVLRPMVFDTSLLHNNGQFTEQSLPLLLAQAFNEKKLTNPDFKNADCLKAKSLGTQGGYNTLQLFLVTSTCSRAPASMYIIKEAREGIDEATKLKEVEKLPNMKELIAPDHKPGFPSIALPLAYFAYPDKKTVHYIAAMPSAKGKSLSDLVTLFNKNQTPQNKELLNRAFYILGKETANFHKLFNKPTRDSLLGLTMAHGDFHFFNLFFDEISGHFTFIDNETMAKSIRNKVSPAVDIVKLFFMPFSLNSSYQQFKDLIKDIDLKIWHEIAVKNFVLGYASAYGQAQQSAVLKELKKIFNDSFSIAWVDFNDSQLQEIRTLYINPILDELIQEKETTKNNV